MRINKPRFTYLLRPTWNESMVRIKNWDADQDLDIIGLNYPTLGISRRKAPRHFG